MASYKLKPNTLPMLGDHLWLHKRGYTHHGLYVGESETGEPLVAHYAGWVAGFHSGPLEITNLVTFSDHKTVYVRRYNRRQYSREQSVERALSRLGEEQYDVIANNCEHLCHWAIMGDQRSAQVEWVDTILGAIHPGLEAASKSIGATRKPNHTTNATKQSTFTNIARDLAIDWGVKSAARWAVGPAGIAAYVGYRLSKQWLMHRNQQKRLK